MTTVKNGSRGLSLPTAQPASAKSQRPLKLPVPAVPDRFMSALSGAKQIDPGDSTRQQKLMAQLQQARGGVHDSNE